MKVDVIVKNARIPQGDDTILTNILVKDEKIAGFTQDLTDVEAGNIIDAQGNLTMPGCIDSHTHFMYQGFGHRENTLTGSAAAATGGVTTVIDMPCCSVPSVRSVEQLNTKVSLWKPQALVDFALWGGVTGEDVREGWLHNVKEQVDAGVVAFKLYMTPSVPTYPRVSDPEMFECFKAVAETGLPVGIHAENFAMCDFYVKKYQEEGRLDGPAWAEARSILAEKTAIQLGISFAEESGARLHIVHMSTGIGAQLVGEAKKRGLSVTAETCPHYLTLNAQEAMTEHGACAKIAPPLRRKEDNEMHWEALRNGSIDFVATDHAPYEIESEKAKAGTNIWTAFPGIPGVETMVPVLVSEGYNKGRISLSRLVEVLSKNAAIHYGLYPKKGAMFIGSDADFTIIDLDRAWTIKQEEQVTLAKYNPLHGMKLKGKPVKTIVRGNLVYSDGEEGVLPSYDNWDVVFNTPDDLQSAEYQVSYRKDHPEKVKKEVQSIKGIMVEPGFGTWIKRQSIQKLDKTIKF
ncbi:dihydroorotase [Marinisporobacter balticus]|uniref:Dihydropyrimidinase/allantoinase n=1 Tax=Marinisporobacter balticus TaxID=2018667 RepID=A0A4R2KME8_9FIRM|nr:dihydroorotase [Marinisporobacter balticus]TCO75271.1 dihydropyrimidinase/allantoinase [Marinisporobacter balticus]